MTSSMQIGQVIFGSFWLSSKNGLFTAEAAAAAAAGAGGAAAASVAGGVGFESLGNCMGAAAPDERGAICSDLTGALTGVVVGAAGGSERVSKGHFISKSPGLTSMTGSLLAAVNGIVGAGDEDDADEEMGGKGGGGKVAEEDEDDEEDEVGAMAGGVRAVGVENRFMDSKEFFKDSICSPVPLLFCS